MGNIGSRPEEGFPLHTKDQTRFFVSGVHITNSRGQTLLRVSPNAFPASRYSAQRDAGDDSPVEYVQDPESAANGQPSFLLRFANADELNFHFTFILRQQALTNGTTTNGTNASTAPTTDTQVSGLTYIFASSPKEVDNLVVREFHADPNLHKNPNVQLVGDYTTGGSPSVQLSWSWRWRPPKPTGDRGGGWRTSCSFVEYDQRAHKLNTLAGFDFWVQNTQRYLAPRSPRLEMSVPPRLRVPSARSIESRVSNVSDSDGEGGPSSYKDYMEPQSPQFEPIPENGLGLVPSMTQNSVIGPGAVKVDVATCKPGEDPAMNEDGPVFRATMRSLEQKTGNMRLRMKKVLRTAEAAETAQQACNNAVADFTDALRKASSSNANAVRPALEHYFEKIAKEILTYERQNTINLHRLIIDPVSKLYTNDIKQADFKKREFDEESKEYYAYTSKYLGQRSESLKEKKQKQSDEKYQAKRRTFELKRFDYSSFMHDLHGGRKDQEVLSQLTKYAEAQARSYLTTAKKVEEMVPQLDALIAEVNAAEKDYKLQRTEREEKRRMLEKSTKLVSEDGAVVPPGLGHSLSVRDAPRSGNQESSRVSSYNGNAPLSTSPPTTSNAAPPASNGMLATPMSTASSTTVTPNSKFKGIRDLDDSNNSSNGGAFRKEGLLWALSRPGSHVDPKGLNKQAWHKFWIVLDQGRLSEYVNWKDKLDLHMEPIDLRMASVREARNSERRFCFEVITPQFTRVYQAPSEDDMKSWIGAINNALQSAFENRNAPVSSPSPAPQGSHRKDIAAVLTGKSSSFSGHRQISNPNRSDAQKPVNRHATTGEKPGLPRVSSSNDAESSALLQRIRNTDEGNRVCADCGADNKVDWCSINLGILLCIECSGIHRSLGMHISKVRSLVLDTSVFTPDLTEILLLIGNRVSNMIWEAKLDRFLKPSPHSTREQRLHFITAKYSDRTYVSTTTTLQSPDDLLLTSIKRNDIQNVLLALALRANPNAHDRSRSTHAVFLALAAADPASPASTFSPHTSSASVSNPGFSHSHTSSTSTLRPTPNRSPDLRPTTPSHKPFAVAELLLQNGAQIPTEPAPIPLSSPAKNYLDFKNSQRLGRPSHMSHPPGQGAQPAFPGAPVQAGNADTLSALPNISSPPGSSGAQTATQGSDRAFKRSSGGFAKLGQRGGEVVEGFARR